VRGVFEAGDFMVFAYAGTPELWVLDGPTGTPTILNANGLTFDGTAALDFGHLAGEGLAGPFVVPALSITSVSIASNASNVQPAPEDRVTAAYDEVDAPAFFDAFEMGGVGLFTDMVGPVFEFEDDGSIFGGQREVHIDVASTDGSGLFAATTGGVYTHDQSYDTFGRSEVVWDGTDAAPGLPGSGSLGLDLDSDVSNAFVIEIERIENYSGETDLPSIGAFVELDEPGRPRTEVRFPFTGPIVTDRHLVLPYHLFGPDLSQVAAVGIVVNGTSVGDFVARIPRVTTTTAATYPPLVDAFAETLTSVSRSSVGSVFAFDRNPITMMGEVEISGQVLASDGIGSLDVTAGEGVLEWSQGPLVLADGALVWDGMDASPSTDMSSAGDLMAKDAGALELTVESLSFDAGVTGGVGISLALVSGLSPGETFLSPSFQLTSPVLAGETIVVPFDDFSGSGLGAPSVAELSEIASVAVEIDGSAQPNFTLRVAQLRTIPMPVPEPGLAASLLVGVFAVVGLGRRRACGPI
jgi:hypothetical protein